MASSAYDFLYNYFIERGISNDISRFYYGDHEGVMRDVADRFNLNLFEVEEIFDAAFDDAQNDLVEHYI